MNDAMTDMYSSSWLLIARIVRNNYLSVFTRP